MTAWKNKIARFGGQMGVSVKISKKGGIAIFSLLGLALAVIIILHENTGPAADPQQELIKKVIT